MATVQTDGSSSVTKSSTVNNGGTGKNVGTVSSILDNSSLGTQDLGVFGSTVIDDAVNDYADPALSAGVFANNSNDPVSLKLTTVLAGTVDNDFLRSAASDLSSRRSIHRQEKVRTTRTSTAYRAGYFNIYTGQWTTTPTTAVDDFWDIANDTTSATSTDEAASPSREIPGELTYKIGKLAPVSVDYSSKNT